MRFERILTDKVNNSGSVKNFIWREPFHGSSWYFVDIVSNKSSRLKSDFVLIRKFFPRKQTSRRISRLLVTEKLITRSPSTTASQWLSGVRRQIHQQAQRLKVTKRDLSLRFIGCDIEWENKSGIRARNDSLVRITETRDQRKEEDDKIVHLIAADKEGGDKYSFRTTSVSFFWRREEGKKMMSQLHSRTRERLKLRIQDLTQHNTHEAETENGNHAQGLFLLSRRK